MTEKEKRNQRRNEEDAVFNRMLLCLLGAVIAEVVILLVKRFYVDMVSIAFANVLLGFFQIFQYAGLILTVVGIVWCVLWKKSGKKLTVPGIFTVAVFGLWVISVIAYYLFDFGIRILMFLPAVAAVLILVYFLYQRAFFVSTILTGGGMAALWLYRQFYHGHPLRVTACFVAGLIVLALVAAFCWKLRKADGKLGKAQMMPVGSNYLVIWLTCAITAVAMILGLLLGATIAYYLLFVLVGWLFCQAVYFTVKLM